MTRSALLAKANKLQEIAYSSPGRNRLIGTAGHEGTVAWITSILDQYPDYYTYYLQPLALSVGAGANLTLGGVVVPDTFAVDLAPSGTVSAPVVSVANLACDLVLLHLLKFDWKSSNIYRPISLPTLLERSPSFFVGAVNPASRPTMLFSLELSV